MTTTMQTASCNNNNYFSAIFNRQSLALARTANRVEQKSKNTAPRPLVNSNSSHSSKNINVKRKEQPVSKGPITPVQKSGTFCTFNPKKRFREDENPNKSSTLRNPNSVENNSRLANLKKRSKTHNSVQKCSIREVENSRTSSTIHNSNSVNSKNRFIKAENSIKCSKTQNSVQRSSTNTANPNKRFKEAKSSNKCSTTHNSAQRNSIENNFRTASPKKCPRGVEILNRGSTVHNVQRNGTLCTSCNLSKEAEDSKKRTTLRVRFEQFTSKSLSSRVKNKDLNQREWEDIRLIKAALINFVDAHEEFIKIKIGKLVWSKINVWVYNSFYPEFIKYLDKKFINRENVELVIKAIMDYYVSHHDGYGKRLKKEIEEKRIYAIMYKKNK